MKVLYKLIILLCLLTGCIGCNPEQNQEKIALPSFDVSIEMHENVLVFDNSGSNEDSNGNELNEIVVFDSAKSDILYKYSFVLELRIYEIGYDYKTDKNNIYIIFCDGRIAKLNVATGKMNEFDNIDLIAKPESLIFFNDEVWISPNYPGFENCPVKYFVYTPATDTSRYEDLPEGVLLDTTPFNMDDSVYLPLYMDNPKIYNYTTKENLDISALDKSIKYDGWHDYYNGFLASTYFRYDNQIDSLLFFTDIYKVKTTTPKLEVDKILELKNERVCGIYETENYLFVYGQIDFMTFSIYDKIKYEQKKELPLNTMYSSSNYVRDGYFYCVKEDTHGVYKISLEDFSVTVIE